MLLKSILPVFRPVKTEHWALNDINLTVEAGESVGIIGRNGAGKTTLLRLLAGVTRPSSGSITIRGRVAPLIGVGVGFHQEMSGRENIYVNALLLGLTKRQVAERLDHIVEFAELHDYIDTPVKFYSTGMFLRLGFSVAAHVDPDILLIDEILAVGDLAFQVKCIDRMRELQRDGTTVVIVSHSMHAIRSLCRRAVLMRQGKIEVDGPSEVAIARHHELMTAGVSDSPGASVVTILDRQVYRADEPTHHPTRGDLVAFRSELRFNQPVDTPQVYFQVLSEDGVLVYDITSELGRSGTQYEAGQTAGVEIPFRINLAGGTYRLCMTVFSRDLREVYAHDAQGYLIYVPLHPGTGGVADLQASIALGGVHVSVQSGAA